MPKTSTSIVTNGTPKGVKVRRMSLQVGDLFMRPKGTKGRVYMHTGYRTRPPSGGDDVTVKAGGKTVYQTPPQPTLGRQAGRDIIGAQAIIVKGDVTPGEDGSTVTFKDDTVILVGRATITLDMDN